MRTPGIGLFFLIISCGLAAAQNRTYVEDPPPAEREYNTRSECQADDTRTTSCCDFTERLIYRRGHDGMLVSELGPEMPTRFVCHHDKPNRDK
jgi:hypothetical protein